MPLMTMEKCFRGRTDCQSFDVIEATPHDLTEEQMETLDYTPTSFVCCGCIKPEKRHIRQDAYRVCFKNETGDDMSDNDEQDLTHLLKVIMTALAVIATRRVARGHIDVPKDFDGGMMNVNTIQGVDAA
jgi:hypothetical protein